jgi:hypothetical protein
MACYRDSFTFTLHNLFPKKENIPRNAHFKAENNTLGLVKRFYVDEHEVGRNVITS